MIVYRELSSLRNDLGISEKALYAVSYSIEKHYHKKILKKANGGQRVLHVPSKQLKMIQRRIADVLLSGAEVSPYATAYRYGSGPSANASIHVGRPILLKLDIRHFFDKIIYPAVKECAFPDSIFSEQIRILLAILCTYRGILPQGAPSSPVISNLILKDFDNTVGSWCNERGILYSRYCDDMTFSGDFDPKTVITLVQNELQHYGFYLNEKKTKIVRDGQKKTVTGYVVNEKLNVPSDYRRKIRQEMHYCMKFGIVSHLAQSNSQIAPRNYIASLLGRVNFVLTADHHNTEFLNYRKWLTEAVKGVPDKSPRCNEETIDNNANLVHIPYFGKVDINKLPVGITLTGMDDALFPDRDTLHRFVNDNFCTFQKSGKKYAVCRAESSLAAVILIVDGILRAPFFQMSKHLLCQNGDFWKTVSEKTLGSDIRNNFPPFYLGILRLFKEYKLLYTNISHDKTIPSAIVIPNYDTLISTGLPRSCRKEVLRRGIGFLAGEKNGIILESLYGAKLYDDDRSLGRIVDYKDGEFTLRCKNGRERSVKAEDCEECFAKAAWNPEPETFFEDVFDIIDIINIESRVEYDRIDIEQGNSGLAMRSNGYTGLFNKMKNNLLIPRRRV